ncbi:hypothetical protein BPO_0632 [Bergeyella porcorum]|uniref:Uncharacterized protein n=1 Tax=Bergeyella porcorum TaxID=1735111 RepID=A0AAU0F0Q3_9FLAO
MRAFGEKYPDLTVLAVGTLTQILRQSFTALLANPRLVQYVEASQKLIWWQVGIRSCDVEEMQYVPEGQCFWAHEIAKNDRWIG